jgi:hypothetical protein
MPEITMPSVNKPNSRSTSETSKGIIHAAQVIFLAKFSSVSWSMGACPTTPVHKRGKRHEAHNPYE